MTDTPQAIKKTCCKRVFHGRSFTGHPCGKPAKIEHDGKTYCGIHDPVRLKECNDAKVASERAHWARQREQNERAMVIVTENERRLALFDEMLEALRGMCNVWVSVCGAQSWEPQHMSQYTIALDMIAKAEGKS